MKINSNEINQDLLARAYSVYEYYKSITELVPFSFSSGGSSSSSFENTQAEDDLEAFIKQLEEEEKQREKEASGGDDGEADGDTAKGLRGDEQMRDIAASMRHP